MKALSIVCMLVFCACASAPRSGGAPAVRRINGAQSDTQVSQLWRFHFQIDKVWKLERERPKLTEIQQTQSKAKITLLFSRKDLGETAYDVACRTLEHLELSSQVLDRPSSVGSKCVKDSESSARFDFSLNGVTVLRGRVHSGTAKKRSTWILLFATHFGDHAKRIDQDLDAITSTITVEPIDW